MGRVCRQTQDWIEEQVEKPIETWENRQEQRCKNEPCNWWLLCLNKLFCWIVWVTVKIVRIIVVTVGKWVVRTVCEITTFIHDVTIGVLKFLGGILSLNPALIKEGADDIVSTVLGTAVVIIGTIVGWAQITLGVQKVGRKLTITETEKLKRVFRESIRYADILLIEGNAGVFSLNNRAFTLGNTIYLKGVNVTTSFDILVHECTHVWQYQNLGARYSTDAIAAQWFLPRQGYPWEEEIARGNSDWVHFNMEAQAAFIQDIFRTGQLVLRGGGPNLSGNGVFYDADGDRGIGLFVYNHIDHTNRANIAVVIVRRGG